MHQVNNVSKLFARERKESRNERPSVEVSKNIVGDPTCLDGVITCAESRFFTYNPETKRQSMHRTKLKLVTSGKSKKILIRSDDNRFLWRTTENVSCDTFKYHRRSVDIITDGGFDYSSWTSVKTKARLVVERVLDTSSIQSASLFRFVCKGVLRKVRHYLLKYLSYSPEIL